MRERWFDSPSLIFALAALAVLPLASPTQARAGEKRAKLEVHVKVDGSYSVAGKGGEQETGEYHDAYELITYVKTDGDLTTVNTKDPAYGQKTMARAAAAQQRVAEAQGHAAPVKKMTPQELQTLLKKKQADCNGDQSCLMKVAMEASQLMANVDFGAAPGAAPPAADPPGTGGDPLEDEEPRYLTYFGFENCGASTHVTIDRKVSGSYDDVQGTVPYSSSEKADYHADPTQLRVICNVQNLVLDVKTHTLYTDGLAAPTAESASQTTDRGQTTESRGSGWKDPGWDWVSEQLRQAPTSGQRGTTIDLSNGKGASRIQGKTTGQAKVELSWKFEDVPG